ncbi:MAG: DUF664 domain-containing protein [Chloroflexi bacterium]|nr:DUF664 domain-containing protein [Chloroflexota bacterium]
MDCKDLILDGLGRIEEHMHQYLSGLTPEQLVFRPDPEANSIGWLAWHLTRVQDDHISDLAGRPQAWLDRGWHARFNRPATGDDTGFGHTSAQVAALQPPSAQVLIDYHAAVHQPSVEYVRSLTCDQLDRELDEPWDPPVTVGVRLISVLDDCMQHAGQMAYIRGLIEARHWLPY